MTPKEAQVGQVGERLQAGWRHCGDVPEEVQSKQAIETSDACHACIGEWSIQQQVCRFSLKRHQVVLDLSALPGFEDWKLMQKWKPRISYQSSSLEVTQLALTYERLDCAIARRRAHQIDVFQM